MDSGRYNAGYRVEGPELTVGDVGVSAGYNAGYSGGVGYDAGYSSVNTRAPAANGGYGASFSIGGGGGGGGGA